MLSWVKPLDQAGTALSNPKSKQRAVRLGAVRMSTQWSDLFHLGRLVIALIVQFASGHI